MGGGFLTQPTPYPRIQVSQMTSANFNNSKVSDGNGQGGPAVVSTLVAPASATAGVGVYPRSRVAAAHSAPVDGHIAHDFTLPDTTTGAICPPSPHGEAASPMRVLPDPVADTPSRKAEAVGTGPGLDPLIPGDEATLKRPSPGFANTPAFRRTRYSLTSDQIAARLGVEHELVLAALPELGIGSRRRIPSSAVPAISDYMRQ